MAQGVLPMQGASRGSVGGRRMVDMGLYEVRLSVRSLCWDSAAQLFLLFMVYTL